MRSRLQRIAKRLRLCWNLARSVSRYKDMVFRPALSDTRRELVTGQSEMYKECL
jgi:hypothetical protein